MLQAVTMTIFSEVVRASLIDNFQEQALRSLQSYTGSGDL